MQNEKKGKPSFLVQGTILAAAGILVRLIGLIYRIPMTNILGEEGIGVYSAAYQIYNIILLLSSYSLPLAVSKMVAARMAVKQYRNAYRVFCGAFIFSIVVGSAAAALTYFGSDFFAESVLNMPEAAYAIRVLAPAIFVMGMLGVLRGYYQGQGTMIPTALSQIFEQIINAIVSVTAAYYLVQYGIAADQVHSTDIYANAYGAAGGTLGTLTGAVTALIFCLVVYTLYKRVIQRQIRRDRDGGHESYQEISRILVVTIVPVVLSSVVYNISSLLDNSVFGYYMESAGLLDDYKSVWGAFSGKYLTIVHVPVAIATSLASSVIPALSRAMARQDRVGVMDNISLTIRFTMLIAIPSAVGMAVLGHPIMDLLFSGNNDLAGSMMVWGSSAVVFFSLSTVSNGILQGINRMKKPMINAAISLGIHLVVLAALLWGVKMEEPIFAVMIANIVFGASMCVLNAISIRNAAHYQQELKKTFLLPLACSAAMGGIVWGLYQLIHTATHSNLLSITVSVVVGMLAYFILLLVLKCVDEVELMFMPMGRSLAVFGKKLRLLK